MANASSPSSSISSHDILVNFRWIDVRNCPNCTLAVLHILTSGDTMMVFSVMLQDYSQLDTRNNIGNIGRAVDRSGSWKCANHTQGPSAPDPRVVGATFEDCIRLLNRSGSHYTMEFVQKIKEPAPSERYVLITDVSFQLDILSDSLCRTRLLSASTIYMDAPNTPVPPSAIREQSCSLVS
jgi:hypothetical protein